MLKRHHWMMISGVIMIVIGIAVIITLIFSAIKDPSEEAVWEGTFGSGGEQKQVRLDADDYEVWCKSDADPGEVTIKDSSGNVVFRDSSTRGTQETITINGVEYKKVGDFEAESSGSYTVKTKSSGTIYITPPIDVFGGLVTICGVAILPFIGIILVVLGIMFWSKDKDKGQPQAKYPAQVPHAHYPPPPRHIPQRQYQQPPPPAPKPEDRPSCPNCGGALSYIEEYDKWYCYDCKEYASE